MEGFFSKWKVQWKIIDKVKKQKESSLKWGLE